MIECKGDGHSGLFKIVASGVACENQESKVGDRDF